MPAEDRALGMSDVIDVDVSEAAQSKVRNEVRQTVHRIQTALVGQRFEKTGIARLACRKCDFRQMCSGYVRYTQLDRQSPRAGTYEQERENELRLIEQEGLLAGEKTK
jgi:radical SAM protein with 4Fe4S-binding SPASM domain